MRKAVKVLSGLGCLVSVAAPVIAALAYPNVNWLFAFVLVGVLVLALNIVFAEDPTPQDLADEIERLLNGNYGGWDVDDFEHQRIRNPQLRGLWQKSMEIGGLPEEWVNRDEEVKNHLREIVRRLRELGADHGAKLDAS